MFAISSPDEFLVYEGRSINKLYDDIIVTSFGDATVESIPLGTTFYSFSPGKSTFPNSRLNAVGYNACNM